MMQPRIAHRLAFMSTMLWVAACGSLPGGPATGGSRAFTGSSLATEPIQVAFNDTYLERIDLNEPRARQSATNTDKNLLRLINGAKTSLDGAFYDIEDPGAAKALIQAKQRGVTIRLVTDTDNMVDKTDPTKPREAITQLMAAGIPIVDDKRSGIMHHKFLVVDSTVVWTGSTNLTPTSLYRHNNNALTLASPRLAHTYATEFERLFVKHEFGKGTRGESLPTEPIAVGEAKIQAFFSPSGGGRVAVVNELRQAKRRIRFLTFSLTDVETGAMMLLKAQAGIKVEGIFDRWLAAGSYSLFEKFKSANLSVRLDGNEALMHHKVMIIDDDVVITGSYNYSQNAEENNNEAFMIIRNAPKLVRAYVKEFDRLTYASIHNHPPAHKKPDAEKKTGETP